MSERNSVLIIDDDRMVRQLLQSTLSRKGFDVYTAEDGQEGLEKARTEKYDLIILVVCHT